MWKKDYIQIRGALFLLIAAITVQMHLVSRFVLLVHSICGMTALLTLTTGGVSGGRPALRHVHIMTSILTMKPEQLQNATSVHTVLISDLILPVLMSALNRQL